MSDGWWVECDDCGKRTNHVVRSKENKLVCVECGNTGVEPDYDAAVAKAARSNKRRNSPGFYEWIKGIVNAALGITTKADE